MKERASQGGADELLLVLSDSAHNRDLVDDLRSALGDDFRANPRDMLRDLRTGTRLHSSGVILM